MDVQSFTGTCLTSLGTGGGAGNITQNTVAVPELLINGTNVVTGTTFVWTKQVENPNTFWAGPTSGAPAVPVFRGLVKADGDTLFWALLGNAGTTAGTNFLGTTDAQDMVVKTNSVEGLRLLKPVSGRPGLFGVGTSAPIAQTEIYRNNNWVASIPSEIENFRSTTVFNKWQTSGVNMLPNQFYVSWNKDPAGYPPPATPFGGVLNISGDITTKGQAGALGNYFDYSGFSGNINFTSSGDTTQTSDGQNGAIFYDGHINKWAYKCALDGSGIVQQLPGTVKLAEFGMHNAIPPHRGSAPVTTNTGIQMNLADKLAVTPGTQSYQYVTGTPGSTTITRTGAPAWPVAGMAAGGTVLLNGRNYVISAIADPNMVLTTPWTGTLGQVHFAFIDYAQVSVTNGSPTVTWVSGGTFTTGDEWRGYTILLQGVAYVISSVPDIHTITLLTAYTGTTCTTNSNIFQIYVAHQDSAIHIQTHSDDRNWNATFLHSHGFGVPTSNHGLVKTLVSGVGGLFNRGIYIQPDFTAWNPLPAETVSDIDGITNVQSALFIDESCTNEMTGALMTMLSPVKAAQPFLYLRQQSSTYTYNMIEAQMAWDGAAPSGSFTGNYLAFYKSGGAAAQQKGNWAHNGLLNIRSLSVGPRTDADADITFGIVVDDQNYTGMTGDMVAIAQHATTARSGIYQRNQTGAYSGNFFAVQAGTDDAGVPSGTFTGNWLAFDYPQGTHFVTLAVDPFLEFRQCAAPAAPDATHGRIYFSSADQKWHIIDTRGDKVVQVV